VNEGEKIYRNVCLIHLAAIRKHPLLFLPDAELRKEVDFPWLWGVNFLSFNAGGRRPFTQ
jgi:hypothetical protein